MIEFTYNFPLAPSEMPATFIEDLTFNVAMNRAKVIDDAVHRFLREQKILGSADRYTAERVNEILNGRDLEVALEHHPDGHYKIKLKQKTTIAQALFRIDI